MVRSTDVLFDHFFILFKRRIFETRTRVVITANSMLYVVFVSASINITCRVGYGEGHCQKGKQRSPGDQHACSSQVGLCPFKNCQESAWWWPPYADRSQIALMVNGGVAKKITSQTPISHGFVATLPFDRLNVWPGGSLFFYKILYVCFSFLPKSMHSMTRILSQSEERYFCSDQYTKFCNEAAYQDI